MTAPCFINARNYVSESIANQPPEPALLEKESALLRTASAIGVADVASAAHVMRKPSNVPGIASNHQTQE